jgi:hypothetical protein
MGITVIHTAVDHNVKMQHMAVHRED